MALDFWPTKSPPNAFRERRERLQRRLAGPAIFASGHARSRNFPANRYPFRADSHFLYLVGAALEGAALVVEPAGSVLYAHPPDPEEAIWSGREPSLAELADTLGIEVRAIDSLSVPPGIAVLSPQDHETAHWLVEVCDRDIVVGGGDELEGADHALAEAMIELRLVHDAAAIAQMRQAAEVTELAHRAGMAATRPGLREQQVRAAMEAAIIGAGMTTSYNSIVSVHGEVLHNEHYENVIGAGDLLLADVGAETPEGWAGDVTRTWPVSGKYTTTQRAVYDAVLAAQLAAISAVRPGVRYRDVHREAGRTLVGGLIEIGILRGDRDDLYERGAAGLFFPHGVGHLIGLDVHDMEDFGDHAGYAKGRTRSTSRGDKYLRLDRDLVAGMAVTIEPGFYRIPEILENPAEVGDLADVLNRTELARFADVRGIRIEDDVLVTETGAEILTRGIPKTTSEVEVIVGSR
jgi:Xaa-Pro aminopeptidase